MRKRRDRKAFTIVELVIVIAVIGILATVLVPTFGDVIQKANQAKDIQTVKNMNTALSLYSSTMWDQPVGNALIQGIDDVMAALAQAGFDTAKELTPVCKDHIFYWYKTTGQIVYVNERASAFRLVYPKEVAGFPNVKDDAVLTNVADYASDRDPAEPEAPGAPSNPYAGKVISILGDSISTLEGYIPVADGFNLQHRARYVLSGKTDKSLIVMPPEETWWMRVINGLDAKLGVNDSWAGSCVSNFISGNSGDLGEKAAMASLTRIQNLGSNGTPDVILFYGGTNDIGRALNLGTFHAASAATEVDLTATKWDTVADAYSAAILRLKYYYPDAQIISMLPTYTTSYYTISELAQYNTVLSAICEQYGVTYVDLRDCGIATSDLVDGIHPNAKGMEYIANTVLESLGNGSEMTPGENIVYSVSHTLKNAVASKSYYKGVSAGKAFAESIGGSDLTVTVTMGGRDITASCYADGQITIPAVTGDIVITAKAGSPWGAHLQTREGTDITTNLWTALTPEGVYYTGNDTWGNGGNAVTIYSITVPVEAGERIYATSFGAKGSNGSSSTDGIRITFLLESGEVDKRAPGKVYQEFSKSGYITVPENAVAVCIPMWIHNAEQKVYIGTDLTAQGLA